MRQYMRVLLGLCLGGALAFAADVAWRPAPVAHAAEVSKNPAHAAGAPSACKDEDGDGYGLGCALGPDCNDWDGAIHPGQRERCNFRDDDCDGAVDDAPECRAPAPDESRVRVPTGAFLMGSLPGEGAADERPRHTVAVGSFELDRHEVTVRRYRVCEQAGACTPPALRSSHRRERYYDEPRYLDYPVIFVGWHQAAAFCRWAGGRLPTEAQWEKAARGPAPSVAAFPWGSEPADCSRANMGGPGSCVGDTDLVGRRPLGASAYGALDLAGNVWEWVADWYDPGYYERSPAADPRGPGAGRLKVMRGGCWQSGADTLRVSCRKAELPTAWGYNVGFRCAYPLSIPPKGGIGGGRS
ncbi:MAG: SUMF1/EgtB/PvdO family nonheme iron enzyme [Deltaproteobacteria bacterium]|nr:SUMF1/EgtB/PvdO family nonheme iron enzyme [Deltaproteobacteria bacterium]